MKVGRLLDIDMSSSDGRHAEPFFGQPGVTGQLRMLTAGTMSETSQYVGRKILGNRHEDRLFIAEIHTII